jgi:hypothetical protein
MPELVSTSCTLRSNESPDFMISTTEAIEEASPNVAWIAAQKGRMSNFIESALGYRWFVLIVMWKEDDRTATGGI